MQNPSTPNRIDPTPVRLSTNLTIDRQTPKTDFGDRLKAGMDAATGALAGGASAVAPFVPGGAIVSAAVSSVGTLSQSSSSGAQSGGAVVSRYASSGVLPVNGSNGTLSTTVATNGTSSAGSSGNVAVGGINYDTSGGTGSYQGNSNTELKALHDDNMRLTSLQIAMQRENQVFSTVSNVLKVRHDTVKNTIGNVR